MLMFHFGRDKFDLGSILGVQFQYNIVYSQRGPNTCEFFWHIFMPQLLEHIVATLGLSYMKFAGMESRETQIKNAKKYPQKRVSQRAQLESRLWPCRHSKNPKAFKKSPMLWCTPRRDYSCQKNGNLCAGPTRERVQDRNQIPFIRDVRR